VDVGIDFVLRSGKAQKSLSRVERQLNGVKNKSNLANRDMQRGFKQSGSAISSMKSLLVPLIATLGGLSLARGFIEANNAFEVNITTLRVLEGSVEAADTAMDLIVRTTKQLPDSVQDVTTAYVRMKALGLDPTEKALLSFGNTAAVMGKTTLDFVEAVADAATNEFERLKEFGIKASQEADTVAFTFQGLTTSVKKDSESIKNFLLSIGNTTFAGAAQKQMDTVRGAVSNLGVAVGGLFVKLGNEAGFSEFAQGFLGSLTSMVEGFGNAIEAMKFVGASFFEFFAVGFVTASAAIKGGIAVLTTVWNTMVNGWRQIWNTFLAGPITTGVNFLRKIIGDEPLTFELDVDVPKLVSITEQLDLINKARNTEIGLIRESVQATKDFIVEVEALAKVKEAAKGEGFSSVLDDPKLRTDTTFATDDGKASSKFKEQNAKRLEALIASFRTEEEELQISLTAKQTIISNAFVQGELTQTERDSRLRQLAKQHSDGLVAIATQEEEEKRKVREMGLSAAAGIFGSLASLVGNSSRKAFNLQKKLSRAGVILSTTQAISNALAVSPYPLGVALAVGAAIKGAANLAAINRTTFSGGGSLPSGGTGGGVGNVGGITIPEIGNQSEGRSAATVINTYVTINSDIVTDEIADKFTNEKIIPAIQVAMQDRGVTLFDENSSQQSAITEAVQ